MVLSAPPPPPWGVAGQSGLGCGFGEAFQTAIAAIVLIAFNSALAWLWMPTEIGQARRGFQRRRRAPSLHPTHPLAPLQDYAFSESAGGISGGAVPEKPSLFSGSAYSAPVERPVLDESLGEGATGAPCACARAALQRPFHVISFFPPLPRVQWPRRPTALSLAAVSRMQTYNRFRFR